MLKFFALFLTIFTSLISSEVNFTQEEKDWIKRSSSIRLGADNKWPPFDFINETGTHVGLSAEYLELIAKKTGLRFDVTAGRWSDIINDMKAKKYDGVTCAVKTQKREKYLKFTNPYLSVPMVLIVKRDNKSIKTMSDLEGLSVSINKGSYIHEWLKKNHPKINLYLTTSNEESLEAVSLGKADAYVGNLAVATFIMNKYLLNNLQIVSKLKEYKTDVSIAIDKDNKMLFNIIQKALSSISENEHQEIKNKWKRNLTIDSDARLLKFTRKQQKWINRHQEIRYVIDNEWKPIEYLSKKTNLHSGISRSYLDLVSEKTGIDFELVPTNSWADSVKKINNEEADLYTVVVKTDSREKVMDFSIPYIKMPQVFVTKKDISFISDIKDLYGKKLALIKGYALTEEIKKEHPEVIVVEVNSIYEALEEIINGNVIAYIDILPMVSYYIQQKGFSNLKISGTTEYSLKFSMALRNDWGKEGIEVINKALQSISEEEKKDIYNQWLHVEYDREIDYTLLWQIIGIFLFFIFGTLYWTKKLTAEIEKRKLVQHELIALNLKLEVTTKIAQSANKAKSDFLSNMSHEIRTPMNAILGFAELLDEQIEDKKLKSFVKTIRNSGETLLFLINDILDLSKIESGKLDIIRKATNVEKLFQETINIFKLQAEQKGIKLELNLVKDMPKSLLVDKNRLKEILINLIGNAIKFTDEGYVKIDVIVDEVYEHNSKIDLRVEVKDTGIGITKDDQDKIFKIFEQSENQDVKKYGGTGLGLAISRKLAELMNGSLNVKSTLTKGSTFILLIKNIDISSLRDEDPFLQDDRDDHVINFKKATILVTDDIKENRDLVKEGFFGTKVKVLEAENGQEAVAMIKSYDDIDLVLMDIRMPIMDGYMATKLIKEISSIPIIALTASIMNDTIESDEFDGYLRKPISKRELFKELTQYLQYSTKIKKRVKQIKVDIKKEDLDKFYDALSPKIEQLYEECVVSHDLSQIREFVILLKELAQKYKIKYIVHYCNALLDSLDSFEIDKINKMLNQYKNTIQELKNNQCS